jgi:hypothetical protein
MRHTFLPGQQAEVVAFRAAKDRCTNPRHPSYKNYGGRGIEFRFKSFRDFWNELGPRPKGMHGKSAAYSLDRINNDGHYEPGNVRWATRVEQRNNTRRRSKAISAKRVIGFMLMNPSLTYVEAAARLGCSPSHISIVMAKAGVRRGSGSRPSSFPVPGTRFGKWVVIGAENQRDDKYNLWFCKCDCGTEKWVRSNNLNCGRSTNCGCAVKSPEHRQMVNERLRAKWTPERRAETSRFIQQFRADYPERFRAARKFTDDQVREIRRMHSSETCGYNKLAKRFNVAPRTIEMIVHRLTYKDVPNGAVTNGLPLP